VGRKKKLEDCPLWGALLLINREEATRKVAFKLCAEHNCDSVAIYLTFCCPQIHTLAVKSALRAGNTSRLRRAEANALALLFLSYLFDALH